MENLEIKAKNAKSNDWKYTENITAVTTFLRHSEDRITVIKGKERVNIEIYQNGEPLFLGDKWELFELLKKQTT